MAKAKYISKKELREIKSKIKYNKKTGEFIWKKNMSPNAIKGCKNAEGMDKEVKSVALNCLKAVRLYGIRPTDFNIEYLDKAIEIISKIKEKE